MRPAVLVTGAAGGLGGATASLLAERGWHVFAGDVSEAALSRFEGHPRVTPVLLDVTNERSIAAAVATVSQAVDGLDGVVNFAGVLAVGAMVEIDEAALARVMDINVMGTYRVNKAFFDLVRGARGRIVTISSETGTQAAAPFNGPYAMSKHAIEAYSDALRRELMLLGVTVVTVRPGPFRTDMVGGIVRQFAAAAESSTHFRAVIGRMLRRLAAEQARAHPPEALAAVIHEILTADRPKPAYDVRHDRRRALLDRLPTPLADAILKRVLQVR